MIIVGERINGTSRKVREAVVSRDTDFVVSLAQRQTEAGAAYLDVNAGTDPEREPDDMVWLVKTVQGATGQLCCIDSPNVDSLRAGLEVHQGQALVNSVSAESSRMQSTIALAAQHGARLVALTLDDAGLPSTAAQRVAIATRLGEAALAAGIALSDLFIDPLARSIAIENDQGAAFLDSVSDILEALPSAHVICGLSNISFQMPARPLLNRTFLAMAMARGMDAAILDPLDKAIMASVCSAEVLLGRDEMCLGYIQAFRAGRLEG
jgi:5-methyltetrahydrofolate corrinoid/iron sulfur protein methyltransferase